MSTASAMARQWARAWSRVSLPSRRPCAPAEAPLEVARASKPRLARTRAEPASQGLGMRKAPGCWWRAAKRRGFWDWVVDIKLNYSIYSLFFVDMKMETLPGFIGCATIYSTMLKNFFRIVLLSTLGCAPSGSIKVEAQA